MKKEKKLKMPIKRIISNNMLILKMIYSSSPLLIWSSIILNVIIAFTSFISNTFVLRYAINGINEGRSFESIVATILFWSFILILTSSINSIYSNYYFNIKMTEVTRDIYNKAYKKAAQVELSCYEDPKYYDTFVKAIDECGERANEVVWSINNLIYTVITFSSNMALIIFIDPLLLVFILISLISVPITAKRNRTRYEKNMALKEERRHRDYSKRTFYLSDYAKEMRLSSMPGLMLRRFKESGERSIAIVKKYGFSLATLGYLYDIINNIFSTLGATLYATWQTFVTGRIGYGDCIIIVNSIDTISWTLANSTTTLLNFQDNAMYIENLRTFLDYEPKIRSGNTKLPESGDLILDNINFRYDGSDKDTLHNVSLKIGKNEKIAIVGHNGAGKSTLVKLLLRLYDTNESITYGGIDIKEFSIDEYRNIFSTVLQDCHVFAMSVKDNVMLEKRDKYDDEIIENALKKGGILEKINELPHKADTLLTKEFDKNGIMLSGGEQQKLAISHIYSKKNRFVILDEPSSALDPIAEYEMYNRMIDACKDCAMIFISHRLSSAVMADRIYLMENGTAAECGTHSELMSMGGRYAEMFKKQAANYTEV